MSDNDTMSLRDRRNRALNDLATVVEAVYGPRCTRREPGCLACAGWAIFDMMEQWTDSSHLDLPDGLPPSDKTQAPYAAG